MDAINTNITSLVGTINYNRHSAGLTKTIENLSTGIKIHSGRDDPPGFIASRVLETEIASTKQAIENCQRSNSLLSVVDSALGEINNLLIDLRQYVTEAASTVTTSDSMLESLQLQVDATLDAIDRIANTTAFQGQKLLDGSLDFTTYGLDSSKVSNIEIYSANFNGATEKDVSFKVLEKATQATLFYQYGAALNHLNLQISGKEGSHIYTFEEGADIASMAEAINLFSDSTGVAAKISSEATKGVIGLSSVGANNDIILTASKSGTDEGNFVIKYVAPEEGNDELSLNFKRSYGAEANEIEIVLKTEAYSAPVFTYEGQNDGINNNEFQIVGKIPGAEFNDLEISYLNVYGTGESTGIAYDFGSFPKTMTISLNYNELDSSDPANTTVNDLRAMIESDPILNTYLSLENLNRSDGTGAVSPAAPIALSKAGVDGGRVLTTAAEIVTLINSSPELKDADGDGLLTAALPSGSTGLGIVSAFSEYAYYGDIATQNAIQFLAPTGAPNIRFVSTPGTQLSVDDTTFPAVYGKSEATVQGFEAGTSFTLRALYEGANYDGYSIIFQDSAEESAVIDKSQNAVIFSIDFTGRHADPSREAFTLDDLKQMVADDPFLGSAFEVVPLQANYGSDSAAFDPENYLNINATMGTLSGGLVQDAVLVVHLETDSNGAIRTTANDLVEFFDNPYYTEAQEVLSKYGISASIMDLPNAAANACLIDPSLNGYGIMQPTYDLAKCEGESIEGPYKEVVFTSYGLETKDDYATADIDSQNGISASFMLTAKNPGAEYNNTTLRIIEDVNGPVITYNSSSKSITIGINPAEPMTANEIISLINSSSETKELFQANRQQNSDGEGFVAVGDRGTLTGGVKAIGQVAETVTMAINGINAVFSITAKTNDAGMDGVAVRVVNDPNGPSVVYDPFSKELAIGIDPSNPLTANEIVQFINESDSVNQMFSASIPDLIPGTLLAPSGNAAVSVGDFGIMEFPGEGTPRGAPMTNNSDNQLTGLTIYAVDYGSDAFVSVIPLMGTSFQTVDQFGCIKERETGGDVVVLINNEVCFGRGNTASVHTSDLDLSLSVDPGASKGDVFGIRITGGGALMQLGPEATSLQQARISLIDVHTAKLGGESGFLSDLRSGGSKDLSTDTKGAFKVIEEVTDLISSLRGRIGAFQKTQLDVSISQMSDMTEISESALSDVRDTDFAAESSLLARQQLLMESTVNVLQRSGNMQRLFLSLLQG